MTQKHNINELMAQYAKELGEDLDDIEPQYNEENAFEDDPEMMKLQKQLNQVSGNLNAKIGAQQKEKGDIYDDMLQQYEQPKNRPQQQMQVQPQQQRPQQKQKGGPDLSIIEQQMTVPEELQSLRVLKQEIGFINSNILPNLKQNPTLTTFYNNLISQLRAKQQNLINEIKEEKLNAMSYQKLVQATFDKEQTKFKGITDLKYKNRIGLRCKTMYDELGQLKDQKFEKICKEFNCAPDNSAKFLYEEFNTKPFKQKAKELFVRHKEWLNLTQYLTNYMKEEKKELIQFLISKLEISKQIQNSLKEGENVDFAKFFILEFKELTEEQFLGMAQPEYQARIQNMIDHVNQANKEEQQYYKVASVAKPIISVIQGTKQMQKINPGDASKQHFARYEQFLKYLTELKDSKWTPLPILRMDCEQRDISTVNKDVPQNVLRVQFKEITGGDKYYLTFEITLGGQQLQFKTEAANSDGKLNHVQDINLRDYKNAAKEVHQQEIIVKAFKKGWLSSDLKGQGKIYLNDLLDMSTYDGTASLGNNKALIFCIQLRESINKKRTVSVAQMVKTYPKFNKDDGLENYIATKLAEIPEVPKVVEAPAKVKQQKQEKIEEEVPQIQPPKLTPDKLIALIHLDDDPEYQKVKAYAETNPQYKEDLLYPENPINGGVFYFLQQYQPFIEKKVGEFRQIPELKMQSRFAQKLFEDCIRQNIKLKSQLGKDIEGYKKNLNMVIQKDQMLLKIYQKEKVATWAKFIEARLEIALKEMEVLGQIKTNNEEQPKQEETQQEGEEDQAPQLTPDKLIALIHLEDDPEYQRVKAFAETVPKFKDELLYPENPKNGSVFYFLQQYTPFIEKKIEEFRAIPKLKIQSQFAQKLFDDCCQQNNKLEEQFGNQDIDGYKKNLEMVIKKDEMFLKIYQKEQAPTWAKFIEARLEIAKQEQQALNKM